MIMRPDGLSIVMVDHPIQSKKTKGKENNNIYVQYNV